MKVIALYKNLDRLVEQAKTNSRSAQHQLYELLAPKMLSACRQYIKDLTVAEEVMLSGFLKVFTNINSFAFKGSFEGWVRRIMVREAISYLRKKKPIHFSDVEMDNLQEVSTSYLDSDIETDYIQQSIDSLPEGYRLVFVMYVVEGYKHAEIASLLTISESTSKSQLFKARKMLQQKLNALNKSHYGTH
ncbi:MAG: RNA polymerase sigma factor [Flavobacteriaceae bacterium]|nr:RNA polymerase sigma factor [Flavobacteriaceae bacterium]